MEPYKNVGRVEMTTLGVHEGKRVADFNFTHNDCEQGTPSKPITHGSGCHLGLIYRGLTALPVPAEISYIVRCLRKYVVVQ